MKIYRAMCKEEQDKTIKSGIPNFHTRFKWFSPNLEWIKQRVQDGKFNNSNYNPTKYEHILEFEWDGTKCDFMSTNEIQFDRRKNPNIKYIKEL